MTPQQYKTMLVSFAVAFVVAAWFSGSIRTWVSPNNALLADAPRVSAVGGEWALTNLEWIDYLGSWRIDATVARAGGQPPLPEDNHALLRALCGAILAELPGARPNGITRQNIFRVSLNFWQIEDGEISDETLYPAPIPVSVLNGGCQPHDGEDFYELTYPGRVYPWHFLNIFQGLDESGSEYQGHFHWQEPGMGPFEQFPYTEVCQYVLLDLSDYFPGVDQTTFNSLSVHAGRGQIDGDIVETFGGHQEFLIVDGQCILVVVAEGDNL